MDPGADIERAGKRFAEVVETLGKNYLGAVVGTCLIPVLKDALLECLADAKKETGTNNPDSIEERLRYNENEKEPDMFAINVDNDTIMSTRYSSSFMAYDVWCVRIGVTNREDKEAKRKPFFVYGQKHRVRYQQLAKVPEKVKKDFPDAKLPAFPPEYVFSSTCCFCITTPAGNRQQHKEAITTFFEAVNHDYPGKTLANFFKCGENYKVQQAMHETFLQAFMATKRTVLRHSFSWDLPPYDAVEALVQLLQAVADDEIIPDMVLRIPGALPGCIRYRMIWNIRGVVFRAIDTAAQGWGPLAEAADKASEKVGQAIKDGADALVDAVKPILKKILTMIQDKMNDGKEGGEEKTEDTKRQLGDIVGSWQFQRSAPGAALFDGIVANGCKDAFANVAGDLANALVAAIKNPIDQMLEKLLGGNLASNPFVQAVVENLVRRVVYKIQTLSSIQGFIDAAQVLAPIIDKMEADLAAVAGQGDAAFDGVIDSSSSALWKGLGNVGLNLFSSIYRLEGTMDRSGESDGATEPLLKFLRHMFVTQMRSFNAIRVTLCNNLRGKFAGAGDADAVKNIVRNEVRNAIFEIVNILVHEMFMTGQQALTNSAKCVVIDKFMDNVWPHISGPLNELAAEMPDALKSFGLDVVSLAETIIELLIGKIVGAVMKKVFLKVEEVVFSQ